MALGSATGFGFHASFTSGFVASPESEDIGLGSPRLLFDDSCGDFLSLFCSGDTELLSSAFIHWSCEWREDESESTAYASLISFIRRSARSSPGFRSG